MGSIEQIDRNTGTKWRAVPWLAGDGGGRRRKGPTRTFETYRDAEAYIIAVERGDDRIFEALGIEVRRNQPRGVTFVEFAESWAAGAGNEWATRRNYRSHVRSLAKAWPTKHIDEIDGRAIRQYLATQQEKGRGPATRAARLTVLRGVFGQALREGLIERDPTLGIRQGKHRRTPRERIITEEQMLAVQAALPEWLRAAVLLSYDSGFRVGEICGLHWAAVDLDVGFATIGPVVQSNGQIKPYPKNGEALPVPLSARGVEALRAHRERFPGDRDELVFRQPRYRGRYPIPGQWTTARPDHVKKIWHRGCAAAGLPTPPYPRWHDLRHGCARDLAQKGTAPHVMQRLMRHLSISSTQVYFPTVSAAEMRAAIDAPRAPRATVEGGGDAAEQRSA